MTDLISEIQSLIISSLGLEDIRPEDIDPDEPLFGEGLGLAVKKRWGITLTAESEEAKTVFRTVRTLAAYIETHKQN